LQSCKVIKEKRFAGAQVRLLREAQQLTLEACAQRLGISGSYLSQIETNQRPLTARTLIALTKTFGAEPSDFDVGDDNRLIADLREASADLALGVPAANLTELRLAATTTRSFAHQFLALHRAYRQLDERIKALDESLGMDGQQRPEALLPYEEVRDFFHYRNNYLHELDIAAESLATNIGVVGDGSPAGRLEQWLTEQHGVAVQYQRDAEHAATVRRFVPGDRQLFIGGDLPEATRTFQLAIQIGELNLGPLADSIVAESDLKTRAARDVARVALANYAAGALLMPYRHFAATARTLRHDIEQLQRRYGTSFEQVCHRLSNLQRPGERGVPFYFVRVDQAGNITKRHSATRFQFARFGGACPLWNIHEAFGNPGRILVQVAEMPDHVRYLCIGRSIVKRSGAYLRPNRHYAVGIGCEIAHADQMVYADGQQLDGAAVPIGISCRICERLDCHQRAFPPVDRAFEILPNERRLLPYVLST
jgi:XRE family transcriptional regulator, fatty acid utilization regulator